MPKNRDNPSRRAECAQCGGPRNCDVRGHFQQSEHNEDIGWHDDWRILQCRGCDYVFIQKSVSSTEGYTHVVNAMGEAEIELDETISYWPALLKRKKPEWINEFGIDVPGTERLGESLLELYEALDNDLNILSAIGIRTTFDVASEILKIDPDQTFKQKLDQLVKDRHIGEFDRTRIETLVDAGSASAHRGWKPNNNDLEAMTEILEHFVYNAFIAPNLKIKLDAKANKIKSQVPPRKKSSNTNKN